MTKLPQMDTPEPPAPVVPPPAPAKPGKLRLYLVLGAIVAFLVFVLFSVRNNQYATDLAVGTCFDRPTSSDITTVTTHPCTEPHDAEVMWVDTYADGAYPGDAALSSFIDDACGPKFTAYVGESVDDSADLSYGWYYPTEDAWKGGGRKYSCYVARPDGAKLTQSVKGSAGS